MVSVALIAYVAATAAGMVVGSLAPFWCMVLPLMVGSAIAAACVAGIANSWREGHASGVGATWGALAGSFATSTCGPTHAHSWLGSDVAAVVVSLVAIALVLVADMLPRAVAGRPHALCGLLFLSTVGLALALGAEVPAWP
jgi:hypothetical protein